jgi:phenylpropionate dioxygenase-like ring-hydroxylating dioxygenase large terminal subunit
VRESNGALFLFNATELNLDHAPDLMLPEELTSPEWSSFLCFVEWRCDYRYVMDNVMDPMHGAYLHKQSHTMAEGDISAVFQIRDLPHGFIFEKKDQRGVNFDWTEWSEAGHIHTHRLEIPYPKTGGPGGNFTIIGAYVPEEKNVTGVFFWRCRKVSGWQKNTWRFLYKNRLEQRHWQVLEQDRVAVENMEPTAKLREHLYQHDMGIVRQRRRLRTLAQQQLDKASAKG